MSIKTFLLSFGIIAVFCGHYALGQEREKSFSVNFGVNLAYPTFINLNEESFTETKPGYQLAVNKDFYLNKHFGISTSVGLNKNSFNAGKPVGSASSVNQLDLSYLSFEAGPSYKVSTDRMGFWSTLNLRVSRLIAENYSDYYYIGPSLSSADAGLNLRLGAKLLTVPMQPYLLVNYYYGVYKVINSSLITDTGQSFDDSFQNRSIGLQIGFYF